MRPVVLVAAAVVLCLPALLRRLRRLAGLSLLAWVRCKMRSRHKPVRHPLGGFRCVDCGVAGADLEDLGFDDGWVSTPRDRDLARWGA